MIPHQTMMNDALSPHTPSPLPAHADATVTGTDIVYLAGLQPQPVEVGAWWWILPHPDGEYPPLNEARCSNKLLEHLEHLHETNDLFGNVAKSQNLRK
jgi:hypothetical protein